MSKMSWAHAELSEQASELGFENIEQAEQNGYQVAYKNGKLVLLLNPTKAQEIAHNEWLKERDSLLARVDKVWENPTQDDLLKLVDELVKFIKQGEI